MNYFKKTITSKRESEDFLTFLNTTDQLFHPEEDPRNIIINSTGELLFNEEQSVDLENRLDEIYEYLEDPCEYILTNFYKE
jgi:hypothetical protein